MNFFLPKQVVRAIDALEAAGYAAYAVGGCVRDQVLGIMPHDYDVCTAASPEEMQRVFENQRTIETGLKHGTLTVLMGGMPLEITTFRQDGDYLDGRHPETVRFTRRVEDDLSRRDFTINAMAYSPTRGLCDPFGGREDCAAGIIRCVGVAEKRLEEDALRILRALRFSARLGFPIEEHTARAIHEGKAGLLRISTERISSELNGLLLGGHAGEVLAEYPDVLGTVLPLRLLTGHEVDWPCSLRRIDYAAPDLAIRWAALLLDAGLETAGVLRALKMPVKLTENVSHLVRECRALDRDVPMQEMLMRLGPDQLRQCLLLRQADRVVRQPDQKETIEADTREKLREAEMLIQGNACCTLGQLAVNGRDMAALGLKGKAIGQTLNALLLAVVRSEIPNEKEALMKRAASMQA
ncbi:MAG: tRNA nucleotidyltransferase [Clostridia bacterium]|nr:tRNA nucleotidyltransferase [Clostridia bacterium]